MPNKTCFFYFIIKNELIVLNFEQVINKLNDGKLFLFNLDFIILTTLMVYLLIKQSIKDYVVWKDAFDQFLEYRKIGGELSCEILEPSEEESEHTILSKWVNQKSAQEFLESQSFEMIKELEDQEPSTIKVVPKKEIE